ncbi:hypothetical protein BayCH28_03130 [Mycolicibacterium sp. CH28]|uniref:type II secretion system F family protein n=1 Tax=Mycolicibacterium sp. CH28 TaxID=2512237 RepID=UPI0010808437|nr:type II secretion system F family protein [Mycolicibacterium sp. CH28]TGD89615.1 hypothetical protein BayCH28_03130 [Mycolicibacterium sp. CH28]
MSGIPVAGLLLALAVLVAPPPPRRLGPVARLTGARVPVMLVAAALAAVLLSPTAVAGLTVLGATLIARRRRRDRDRLRTYDGQNLATALETLVGELRVGAHPVHAFGTAATESDGGTGAALRAVAARARLGADVAGGLRAMAAASSVPAQWERLAVCWQLAADHGLAMAALMRAAQRDIIERHRFAARVQAGLAGARATAGILAGLPLLGVLLGQVIGANPIRFLLGGGAGGVLLAAGLILVCAGLLWADRITDRLVR